MSTDRIERSRLLKAPRPRVWRALTDAREFGTWFRVKLDGSFERGQAIRGHITHPGYEHLEFEVEVERMEPEHTFSFRWHPYAVDPDKDYSGEPRTLVVFTLQQQAEGTMLTVVESGFDSLPPERRDEAFRMNDQGWAEQVKNIAEYVQG
jgi:uncharacterized protein YndB with AHSA1/START domain